VRHAASCSRQDGGFHRYYNRFNKNVQREHENLYILVRQQVTGKLNPARPKTTNAVVMRL
jgi:hypothetical protein